MKRTGHSKGLVAVFVLGIFIVPLGVIFDKIAIILAYALLQSVVFAYHTHGVIEEDQYVGDNRFKPHIEKKSKQTLISESMDINEQYREFFTEEEKDYVDRLLTRYMSKEEYQTAMDLKSYLLFLMSKYC